MKSSKTRKQKKSARKKSVRRSKRRSIKSENSKNLNSNIKSNTETKTGSKTGSKTGRKQKSRSHILDIGEDIVNIKYNSAIDKIYLLTGDFPDFRMEILDTELNPEHVFILDNAVIIDFCCQPFTANLIICDSNMVYSVSSDGDFLYEIICPDKNVIPTKCWCSENGNIYMSHESKDYIYEFDPAGRFIKKIIINDNFIREPIIMDNILFYNHGNFIVVRDLQTKKTEKIPVADNFLLFTNNINVYAFGSDTLLIYNWSRKKFKTFLRYNIPNRLIAGLIIKNSVYFAYGKDIQKTLLD